MPKSKLESTVDPALKKAVRHEGHKKQQRQQDKMTVHSLEEWVLTKPDKGMSDEGEKRAHVGVKRHTYGSL